MTGPAITAVIGAAMLCPAAAQAQLPDQVSDALGGGVDGPWALLLALSLTSVLVAGAGYLLFGDLSQRRRDIAQRAQLAGLGQPALISTADGRVIWANDAAPPLAGEAPSVLEVIDGEARVDAEALYRVASEARRTGTGAAVVARRHDPGHCLLSARLDEPDHLIWTLAPEDLWADDRASGPYAKAAFAYIRRGGGGEVACNPVFAEHFGAPPAPGLIDILQSGTAEGERILLPCHDGTQRLFRAFVVERPGDNGLGENGRGENGPGENGLGGDGQDLEAYIFPLQDAAAPRGGAAAVLEEVPVALVQFDLEGRTLWQNRLAAEMIGQVQAGTRLSDLVVSLGRPIKALVGEAVAERASRREMVRLRAGTETFLQIFLTRARLDETETLLAVLSDASELRQLEDKFVQSQKMEAVGKLAGGVAHDFNNVLTAISGHADLLLLGKDALNPDYSDLTQIRQNTHRAAALVRQLLAFSRKQTLNPSLLSVQDVVSDTQYLLNRLIGERVTLTVDHGRDLGPVRADQQQLEQALMNLVVNARDAMPNGGTITIATRNVSYAVNTVHQGFEIAAGDYVEISVSDEGSGVEPHALGRVFEPFFTTKAQGEGTGLGLSTVYGIVKQSGGYIFVDNRPEGGARFQIILPRAQPGQAETAPAEDAAGAGQARDLTGKGAILLVEDEDPVRSFASRALRLRGYEVLEAASAEDAMGVLQDTECHIDLLVSDVVMPGTDGPTLAAFARKMRPELRVVFISGYAEDSFRRNLIDHDFTFLPKPFSLVDLTVTVKEALARPVPGTRH